MTGDTALFVEFFAVLRISFQLERGREGFNHFLARVFDWTRQNFRGSLADGAVGMGFEELDLGRRQRRRLDGARLEGVQQSSDSISSGQ